MKNHDSIPEIALDWIGAGKKAALATVIETWGSAPRQAGALLAISGEGELAGSVSGGCVEGAVAVEAMEAMEDGTCRMLEYGVSDEDAFAVGLACGGTIRISVEPVDTGEGLPLATLRALVAAREGRARTVLATDMETKERRLLALCDDDPLSDAAREAADADRSGFVEVEGRRWFLAVHNPPLRMAIIGAAHIAQPLTAMARLTGFDVTVIDPRESFSSEGRFPDTALSRDWPDAALAEHGLDPRVAVVCLSHDPKLDDPALGLALRSDAFYIGALGSKKTNARRADRLREAGFDDAAIGRIDAPIGLPIGSRNPAEIAVAIMARIIEALRKPETRQAARSAITFRSAAPAGAACQLFQLADDTFMKFGPVPLSSAEGTILAHSLRLADRVMKKGRLLDTADCAALKASGLSEVIVARIGKTDIGEDAAAAAIARAAAGSGLRVARASTGRCNLHAIAPGVLRVDALSVADANAVDEALTLATPFDYTRLNEGQLAATAKVIPYAVAGLSLDLVTTRLQKGGPALRLYPFRPMKVALILTEVEGAKASLTAKGADAVRSRVEALGSDLQHEQAVPHAIDPLAAAIREAMAARPDLLLILAGSATSDRADIAPSGIVAAGGHIERFGMPVDPGNLLVLARIGGIPAIVLPGCARSPALNGADWVLERIAAGLQVTPKDIAAMGVGGLLKEIPTRPQPREGKRP